MKMFTRAGCLDCLRAVCDECYTPDEGTVAMKSIKCHNCRLHYDAELAMCPNCNARQIGDQASAPPERTISVIGSVAITEALLAVSNERIEKRKVIDVACETIALATQRIKELDDKKATLERDLERAAQPPARGAVPKGFA